MSKNNKAPFQLKPKHLIRAFFLVSFVAVAALVVGVFSTLNSGKTEPSAKNPAEQNDTRIEVWRPNGTIEPETVQPAKDGDAKTASANPVVPQDEKGEKAEEGVKNDHPAVHRSKRTENKRTETDKSENTQSDDNSSAAQNKPKAESQPVENKPEKAKAPESKPTPKAEPEAKPQAKPRNKDNLDNLF
ncbi:TPA: hypothetical protein ACFU2R_000736 [Neisseria subflava]